MSAPEQSLAVPGDPDFRRLAGIAASLAVPRERIESAFLAVGGRLAEAAILLNRIVAAFEALPRDLEGERTTAAMQRLGAFAREAREIAEAFAAEGRDVAALKRAVAAAAHPIEDLQRAVRLMEILAVNARIVAAGLDGAADRFGVFTTDIANLAQGARRAIASFAEGHKQLAAAVGAAAGQFTAFDQAHRETLASLVASLEAGLGQVEARRSESASRSAETARVSGGVAMRIASAVMALQVGDATRQRVQHAEEAMTALATWLSGGEHAGIVVPAAAAGGLASLALRLAGAQLDDTISSFEGETGEAERALVELAADADGTVAECRRLYGGTGGSPLAALGSEMRRAAVLLRDGEAERERLGRTAVAVDETVEVLVGHVEAVQEIEANMRLVGLNAAVKCAQLGPRGAALSVIATQLRELTSELVVAARGAIQRLEEATAAARAFTRTSAGQLASSLGRLEAEAMGAMELLEEVDGRLAAALQTLERDGPAAIARLNEASHGLGGHAGIAEALSDAHFELTALTAETGEASPDMPVLAPVFAALRRGYSMEAERRIHDRLVGAAPEAPAGAEADDALFF